MDSLGLCIQAVIYVKALYTHCYSLLLGVVVFLVWVCVGVFCFCFGGEGMHSD